MTLLARLSRIAPDSLVALAAGVAGRLVRVSRRRVGVVLVYHGVAERPGDPAREILPPVGRRTFSAQMRHLRRNYRVVALSELPRAVASRRRGERFPVAITFDDDLSSHRRLALPLLTTAGLPAAFFLSGASLRGPHTFWWEKLQRLVDQVGPDPTCWPARLRLTSVAPAEAAATRLLAVARAVEHMDVPAQERFVADLVTQIPPDPPDAGMRAADVVALAAAGFEIGFHTSGHHRMTELGDAELRRAMTDGRDELAQVTGRELTMIAYPHGAADTRVATAAADAGYRLGFTTQAAATSPHDDLLLIGRVEAPIDGTAAFAGRLLRIVLCAPPTSRKPAGRSAKSHRRAGVLGP